MDTNNAESSDEISISSMSETDSDECLPDCDPNICSLCEATGRQTTDIEDCEELESIKKYIESTSSKVKKVKYACQTCLYKLYTVLDQNRLKTVRLEREQRLSKAGAVEKSKGGTEPSTSSSPDNETSATTHTFDSNDLFPTNVTPPAERSSNIILRGRTETIDDEEIANEHRVVNEPLNETIVCIDIHEETRSDIENHDSEKHDNVENSKNGAPTPTDAIPSSQSSSQSHLDVMYEQSESALITESGGALEQYKRSTLQCCFCAKVFVLQKPYHKHMRMHQSKLQSTRSGSSSRGRSTPYNKVHGCVDCSATFDSSAKLKTHSRIHIKRYYCTYCHRESLSQFDHDFHEAECRGGHMAKDSFVETRRMTRSTARSLRSAPTRNVQDDAESEKSPASKPKSKRSRLRKSVGGKTKQADGDGDDDDDDGATSVAYTDYTQLKMDVARWVAGTCRSNIGSKASSVKSMHMSETHTADDLDWLSDAENMPSVVVSQKEYDIIMLERLIMQTETNVYTCSFVNCDFIANTLREMCLHEILIHKLKPYFFCRKCNGVFTSKLYLDYHLHLQNFGEYQCHKCDMRFNFEYMFQYHLIQHEKHDSYPCLSCGYSYMSHQDLRIHSLETGHDPKKRKKLITIDPTMTIVNETPPEPPPPKRVYKSSTITIIESKEKVDKPPRISRISRRSTGRPRRRAIFLGEIDFVYQLGHNCVRTK